MKDFGEWIAENKASLNEDVYGLFYDSYRCFKNDIDRPAYLLAYQGMMQHVRVTVLQSPGRPSGFLEAEWESQWLKHLRGEDKWDELAFKCTQQQANEATGKAAVMNIRQEVREKFPFWRQLRNVCAHYKGYDLHKAHSLALYSFIEQYLLTLSVVGGQVSLNRLFDDYYNPVLTSVHEDIQPLLDRIDGVIQNQDFNVFFIEVRKSCGRHASFTTRFHEFMHSVLERCPARVREAAIRYIQSDDEYRDDYLEKYPGDVLQVLTGAENIHQFWYARLPHKRSKLTMLALMMSADYIPEADREEAMQRCLRNAEDYPSGTDYYGLAPELSRILAENGFFHLFYEMYFNAYYTSHNVQPICYKTDFYIGIINLVPWDKKYVEQLIAVFGEAYFPFTLRDRLRDMYHENVEYRTRIDQICADEGLTLPAEIICKRPKV